MATFTTKFNIGDEVFIIHQRVDLNKADHGSTDLLESILSEIRRLKIVNIVLDNNGVRYNAVGIYGDHESCKEDQLFATEKEVVIKLVTDLKNHLVENLELTEDLIIDLKENYEELREECSK